VVIFAVGFAALNTGNNLLYLVLSLMLAFLVLSGLLSESALRGIQVRRRLPRELFAGTGNSVCLEIHNAQRRVPSFAIVVEDRYLSRPAGEDAGEEEVRAAGRVFVLRVGPGESEARRYSFHPPRRGPLRFAGFQVSTRFPFGLFLKSMRIDAREETLIYPTLEALEVPLSRAGNREHGSAVHPVRGLGTIVSGLRDFELGDPLRRIHWRSSLRRSRLLVRELEDERDAEVEVLLRTWGHEPGEAFEKRVSWAASEAVAHLEAGLRVALRTDGERLAADSGTRHRARLLSFLARVTPDAQPRAQASSR
jgi:uncharacterized protein (DUF58 family)